MVWLPLQSSSIMNKVIMLLEIILGVIHSGGKQIWPWRPANIDGLVQERRNSSALAMDLRLSCTNLSIYAMNLIDGALT